MTEKQKLVCVFFQTKNLNLFKGGSAFPLLCSLWGNDLVGFDQFLKTGEVVQPTKAQNKNQNKNGLSLVLLELEVPLIG